MLAFVTLQTKTGKPKTASVRLNTPNTEHVWDADGRTVVLDSFFIFYFFLKIGRKIGMMFERG